MVSERSLLLLSDVCLNKVLEILPHADRLRFSRVCRDLHLLWRRSVRTICISQQDLELYDDQSLKAFETVRLLRAESVDLDWDCACFLAATPQLQQLTSIIITDPVMVHLSSEGLSVILTACSVLECFQIQGDWADVDESSDFCCWLKLPQQRPHKLQHLAFLRSISLSAGGLLSFLAADCKTECPANNICSTSCSLQCCNNSSAQGSPQLQQLLMTGAAANGLELSTSHPAWPHLHTLDLSGCTQLGDSWGFLALVPELHTLKLHSCYKVTNHTLQAFSKAVNSNSHTDVSTAQLSDSLTGSAAAAAAAVTSGLPCTVHEAARAFCLRKLDLSYTRVNDGGMCHLAAALPQLQWLCLKGCNVGDDGLLQLLQLQQLTALLIKHCHRVTEEGVQQLAPLSNLRELSFGYTSLPEADDIAAAIAGQFKQLTALDLLSSELTDTGMAAVGSLPQLQHLKLYQAEVTVDALRQFGEQPAGQQLTGLVLYGLGGLSKLESLSSLTALRDLQLGGLCQLADVLESIKQLALLPNLRQLTLERIDDITLGCLEHVLAHVDLYSLKVRGCDGVSQEEMEELSAVCAERCGSSASIFWAASASCDTDDEDDGWQLLPV